MSVDDIAARADVSPRTFFNYYPSKDHAILGLDPAAAHRLAEAFALRPARETPMQALHAVLLDRATEMAEESELWPLRIQVIESHPVLLARLMAGFAESERELSAAIVQRTSTHVGSSVYPALLAAVQSGRTATPAAPRYSSADREQCADWQPPDLSTHGADDAGVRHQEGTQGPLRAQGELRVHRRA